MRSVIWFYLFWAIVLIVLSYALSSTLFSEKNVSINTFEIINTDTLENIIEYPKDGLVSLERFFPMIIPKSGYVEKGDTFEAKIVMGVLLKNIPKMRSVSVNGQRVSLNKNSIGYYSEEVRTYGKKRLNITENIRSNLTGERMSGSLSYEYFVGLNENEWKELTKLKQDIKQKDIEIKENKIEELRQYYLNKYNK
ncbi:MAG: hypothetical protein ACI94Y_003483 [Maribacter sp.]|jgi:hypothetical protein